MKKSREFEGYEGLLDAVEWLTDVIEEITGDPEGVLKLTVEASQGHALSKIADPRI